MTEPEKNRGVATVRVSRSFDASAEAVFDAWLDEALVGLWMFGTKLRDEEVLHIKIDPRVGGKFSFLVRRGDVEIDHVGEYREINRPLRLAFTWGIAGESAGESLVAIEIQPKEAGCELLLTHSMDAKWAEYSERVQNGWTTMLDCLATNVFA